MSLRGWLPAEIREIVTTAGADQDRDPATSYNCSLFSLLEVMVRLNITLLLQQEQHPSPAKITVVGSSVAKTHPTLAKITQSKNQSPSSLRRWNVMLRIEMQYWMLWIAGLLLRPRCVGNGNGGGSVCDHWQWYTWWCHRGEIIICST